MCVRVCVRACVRARARACVCVCVCTNGQQTLTCRFLRLQRQPTVAETGGGSGRQSLLGVGGI